MPFIYRQNNKDDKFKDCYGFFLLITLETELVYVAFFVCIFFQICDKFIPECDNANFNIFSSPLLIFACLYPTFVY